MSEAKKSPVYGRCNKKSPVYARVRKGPVHTIGKRVPFSPESKYKHWLLLYPGLLIPALEGGHVFEAALTLCRAYSRSVVSPANKPNVPCL